MMQTEKIKKLLKDVLPWMLVLGVAYFFLMEGQSKGDTLAEGTLAPDFEIKLNTGKSFRLSEHRGEVVVLSFWATWCQACKFELPWVSDLAKEYEGNGVSFVGLSLDQENLATISEKAKTLNIHLPVGRISYGTSGQFGVSTLPTTFVIAPDGKVSDVFVGVVLQSAIENAVEDAMKKPSETVLLSR